MNLAQHIRAAWPGGAPKEIARKVPVSVRTGRRMAESGIVPRKWKLPVLTAVERSIERNMAELERLLSEVRHEQLSEMLARSADRRARAADPRQGDLPGLLAPHVKGDKS